MEIKNMDKYFSLEILRRGYDYYKKGKVLKITKNGTEYSAKVNGSEVYNVTILNDSILKMTCSCPYAEEHTCKHMAAVLYCLRSNSLPVKENNVKINFEDITDFQRFERMFKKEFYRLFHNHSYINDNEFDDYENLIYTSVNECKKYIGVNNDLSYSIFEFLLLHVANLDVYDRSNKKEKLYTYLFNMFSESFKDERILSRFIIFLRESYIDEDSCFYFYDRELLLNLLYEIISFSWQAQLLLKTLNQLYNDSRIYDYMKDDLLLKIVLLYYNFVDKEKALKIAYSSLDVNEICYFLINLYDNNLDKKIELLEKIIDSNSSYCDDEFYNTLLEIYEENDYEKYLKLLKRYLIKYPRLETYVKIKEQYDVKTWSKIRSDYLKLVRNSKRVYMDICIEEGLYNEILDLLSDSRILDFDDYLDVLICHMPKRLLKVYKDKVVEEISHSYDRQMYRKCLDYFLNLMKIPDGEEELKKIISDVKMTYTNKRALLEEIDFFECTYL